MDAFRLENRPNLDVGIAADLTNIPDVTRPLRITSTPKHGHIAGVDVIFRSEGNDLYVRFQSRARTRITFLRRALCGLVFLLLTSLTLGAYTFVTCAYRSWVMDYAQKHARADFNDKDKSSFYYNKITEGYCITDCPKLRTEIRRAIDEDKEIQKEISSILVAWKSVSPGIPLNEGLFSPGDADPEAMERGFKGMLGMLSGNPVEKTPSQLRDNEQVGNFLGLLGVTWHMTGEDQFASYVSLKQDPPLFFVVMLEEYLNRRSLDQYCNYVSFNETDLFHRLLPPRPRVLSCQYLRTVELPPIFRDPSPVPRSERPFPTLWKAVSEAYKKSTLFESPWSPMKLAWADPKIAFWNFGMPASIILGVVATLVWLIPVAVVRYPCRLLGWPMPDEFSAACLAHCAWVERVLSDMLLNDYGIQEGDKFAITSE